MSFLSKIFGDASERYAQSLAPLVADISALEPEFEKLSGGELRAVSAEFRARLEKGETLDDLLPEAFAAVREAARRSIGQRHFDVQLIGGIVLHRGKIAEMRTGEGKTLVATLPLYLNALEGKGAHLVTPNDYLSRIGAGWMGPVYHALGMTTAVVAHDWSGIYDPAYRDSVEHGDDRLNHFRPVTRHEAYRADITYATNNELGFDYLRDNLEYNAANLRQREPHFAIVDEIDSILIDEARTPLIISMPDEESAELYKTFARVVPKLKESVDYNVDEKLKAATITEAGIDKIEEMLGIGNIYDEKGVRYVRHLESALRARALFQRDRDYVVKNGEVIIVDEFTGRLMPGRRWSEGLHQAVEAKEGVEVQKESRTLATITFQNFFRMYGKLAGMTGTAATSAEEFHKVYKLDVVKIPTHRPMVRRDMADLVFRTAKGRYDALVAEVKVRHEKGQPVLIGTVSIEKNERVSRLLEVSGVPHEVLNAKNHEREALIIAQAGKRGAVTVATNMAGRGVDILLGGSPQDPAEAEAVRAVGGLHVIGTERHEARRIDNQLRGRAGRQGDPGSSQFFISLEDDLMRIFGSEKIKRMMETLGIPEDQPIEHGMVEKAIEAAQSKIEGFHFDSRKHLLEYDDVLNKQREAVYRMRREALFGTPEAIREKITEILRDETARLIEFHAGMGMAQEWNLEEIFEMVRAVANVPDEVHRELERLASPDENPDVVRDRMLEYLMKTYADIFAERTTAIGEEGMRNVMRFSILRSVDVLWMDHLDQMEHLRDSVRLRAYGQRDPLVEYKHEGTRLFRELQAAIRAQVVNTVFKIGVPHTHETAHEHERMRYQKPDATGLTVGAAVASIMGGAPPAKSAAATSVGRNDPCPCGSGKKYKKCHGIS